MRIRLLRTLDIYGVRHRAGEVFVVEPPDWSTKDYIILMSDGVPRYLERGIDVEVVEEEGE